MTVFEHVREIVARDARPIRPVLPPLQRVLLLAPIAVAVAALAQQQYGRDDFEALGTVIAWGLSVVQWTLGLVVLGIALCLAVPGYRVSRTAMWLTCTSVIVVIAGTTAATYFANPTSAPPDRTWRLWYLCLTGSLELGIPLLFVSSLLAARAFPTNPSAVGALCGLAAGLVTDSGWRLTCWVSAPSHIFTAHQLAVAIMTGAGAIFAALLDRRRWRSS